MMNITAATPLSPDPQRRLHTGEVVQALCHYAQVCLFEKITSATSWLEAE
ncbi:hypothetical protein [Hymenobacter lutimineralis]|nr:hypothetical protein [Hymenobacter lutimineralis]